jgi:hypothetical protein
VEGKEGDMLTSGENWPVTAVEAESLCHPDSAQWALVPLVLHTGKLKFKKLISCLDHTPRGERSGGDQNPDFCKERGLEGEYDGNILYHMYVNGKMKPVEIIPGMGDKGE